MSTKTIIFDYSQVDESQLKLTVNEALRRGLIAKREIDQASPAELKRSLRELAGQLP